jgi:hypothetical protein
MLDRDSKIKGRRFQIQFGATSHQGMQHEHPQHKYNPVIMLDSIINDGRIPQPPLILCRIAPTPILPIISSPLASQPASSLYLQCVKQYALARYNHSLAMRVTVHVDAWAAEQQGKIYPTPIPPSVMPRVVCPCRNQPYCAA